MRLLKKTHLTRQDTLNDAFLLPPHLSVSGRRINLPQQFSPTLNFLNLPIDVVSPPSSSPVVIYFQPRESVTVDR